jgi:hypothetical protein
MQLRHHRRERTEHRRLGLTAGAVGERTSALLAAAIDAVPTPTEFLACSTPPAWHSATRRSSLTFYQQRP